MVVIVTIVSKGELSNLQMKIIIRLKNKQRLFCGLKCRIIIKFLLGLGNNSQRDPIGLIEAHLLESLIQIIRFWNKI